MKFRHVHFFPLPSACNKIENRFIRFLCRPVISTDKFESAKNFLAVFSLLDVPVPCFTTSINRLILILKADCMAFFLSSICRLYCALVTAQHLIFILYEICNKHSKHLIQQCSDDNPNDRCSSLITLFSTKSKLFISIGEASHK